VNPSRRIVLATSSLALVGAFMLASICLATPFSIHWTAPGDDSLIGRASLYDLRYSNLPITAANFGEATPIAGLPAPAVAGTRESLLVSGLADGVAYYLAIKSVDEAGNWSPISNLMTRLGQTTDVALAPSFSSPWPNPAHQAVQCAYSLSQSAHVQVDVFDITGRHVHTVANGEHGAGRAVLSWDLSDDGGRSIAAGVYIIKARIGSLEWMKRLTILR